MLTFYRIQPQRLRDGIQHRLRKVQGAALFQTHIVIDTDPGHHGQLLAAQTGHPAAAAVIGQADLLRAQPRPPGTQEFAEFGTSIQTHVIQYPAGCLGASWSCRAQARAALFTAALRAESSDHRRNGSGSERRRTR